MHVKTSRTGACVAQSKKMMPYVLCILAVICTFGCKGNPAYTHTTVHYQGPDGRTATAVYHNPADQGDYSVTLTLDNKTWELPWIISASGVRYSDGKNLVWWTKGDQAFVLLPDGAGDWTDGGDFTEIQAKEPEVP